MLAELNVSRDADDAGWSCLTLDVGMMGWGDRVTTPTMDLLADLTWRLLRRERNRGRVEEACGVGLMVVETLWSRRRPHSVASRSPNTRGRSHEGKTYIYSRCTIYHN
jgi:hypothetical protein